MRASASPQQYRWLPWLIIGMAVLTVTTVALALHYVESRLVASKGESLALAAAEIADKLDLVLAEQYDDTLELSRTQVFRERGVAAQSAYLATVKATHPIYLWLGVTDAGGQIVAATDPVSVGRDRSKSSWFQAARNTDGVHVSAAEPFEETGGTDAISFTTSIKGAGRKFQGIVTARVGLPALEEVLTHTIQTFRMREAFAGSIEYQFMNDSGAAFIDSDLEHKGNVNLKQMGLPSALLSESGKPGYVEELHKRRGIPVITGYAQTRGFGESPDIKWTILLRMNQSDLLTPIRKMLWTLGLSSLLIGGPLFIMLVWSTTRLKDEWALAQEEHARAVTAELKYRQLVDQARDILYRTDDQGHFTFVNPIVTRIMGYSPQELLGRRFVGLIRPDARAAVERFYGWQFVRKTPSTYYEFPAMTKENREIWIGQNVQVLLENGRVTGFHAVARDITERKLTEEKLLLSREIITNAHDPISIMDLRGRFTYQNPAHASLVGFSDDELLGKTPALFLGDEAFASICRELSRAQSYRGDVIARTKDGIPKDLELSVFTIRDAANKPACFVAIKRDITGRKRTEEALRTNEQRMRAILDGALDAVVGMDEQGVITDWNPQAEAIFGWSRNEAIGQHLVETMIPPRYREQHYRGVKHFLATGEGPLLNRRIEITALRRDGTEFPVELTISALKDGAAHRFTAFIADITVRKQAEKERKAMALRNAALVKALGQIVYDWRPATNELIWGGNYTEVLGYSPEDMGTTTESWTSRVHPDDLKKVLREVERATHEHRNYDLEYRFLHRDGSYRWMHDRGVLTITPNGELERIIGVFVDITERKQADEALRESERRFRTIFDQAPIGMAVLNSTSGQFRRINQKFCEIVGYPHKEMLARTFQDITHPDDLQADLDNMTRLMEGRIHNFQMEKRYIRKDGAVVWVNLMCVSLWWDHATDGRFHIAMVEDITERKRAEAALREQSRQQTIEAELSLLAVTAPDLPNLLNATIKLVADVLGTEHCEVLQLLPNSKELLLRAGQGWKEGLVGRATISTGFRSLVGYTMLSNVPVVVEDFRTETRFKVHPLLHDHGIVSGMSFVISGKDEPWGTLGAYTTRQRSFSRDHIAFFRTVSNILATAIERMQTEDILRSANQTLRTLSRQLLQVQEEDRRMIARDLHDEIGQSLTAIKLNVERAQRTSDRAARDRIMKDCVQITDSVLNQVRDLSLDLHPSILDDLGLSYALKWYADRQAERAGLKVEVTADPSGPRLPRDIEIACFRIAQEALTNIVRHAQASRANITLKRLSKRLELRIQDDGIGFDVEMVQRPTEAGTSIGLTGMRERARLVGGEVHVKSVSKKGTEVTAIVPLPAAPSADTTAPPP